MIKRFQNDKPEEIVYTKPRSDQTQWPEQGLCCLLSDTVWCQYSQVESYLKSFEFMLLF